MKYNEVPFILTGKDLDYIQDAFNWEYGAYKNAYNTKELLEDESLAKQADNLVKMHNKHMEKLLSILKEAQDESTK